MTEERDFEAEFEALAADIQARRAAEPERPPRPPNPAARGLTARKLTWIERLTFDATLSRGALRVGLRLASYVNLETGDAWPAQKTLAVELSISERAVRYAVDELIEKGHLIASRANRRASNRYRLAFDERKREFPSKRRLRGNPPAAQPEALRGKIVPFREEAGVPPIPIRKPIESSQQAKIEGFGSACVSERRRAHVG